MNSVTKVGIMTLCTVLLLAYIMFVLGDLSLGKKGYTFAISFYSVNGLNKGSTVAMSGVKIGKVEKIEIRNDQVYVYAYIRDESLYIRRKSTFTISTAGLMGEKFIEIMPTRDYTSQYVENGEVVSGTDPTRIDELFEQGNILLQKLQELTASAKDIVGDPELKENTMTMFRNAREASDRAKEIIESVQKRTDSIVENLDSILKHVDDEVARNKDDIRVLIANFKEFSDKLASISKNSEGDVQEIITNVRNITKRIDKMVSDLNKNNKMTDDLHEMIDALKDASLNTREITKEVKEIVEDKKMRKRLNTALDDAHKLTRAVDKIFLSIKQTRIDFKYLLRYNENTKDFHSDLTVDVYPNENTFYRFGVEDVGGEDQFNLMVARGANTKLVKRGGIISSKVGLGVDYYLADTLNLGIDIIDVNDTEVRFKVAYLLDETIRFELRIDDINSDKEVNFGFEYKF